MPECDVCHQPTTQRYRYRPYLEAEPLWLCRDCLLDTQSLQPPRKEP
jgi:hypothetical protein